MRRVLLTTVAVAAFSCAGVAVQAQEHQGGVNGAGGQMGAPSQHASPGAAHGTMSGPEQGGAGAMRHAQGGEHGGPAGQQPGTAAGTRSMEREGATGDEHRGQDLGNKSADQQRGSEERNRSAEEQRGNEHGNRSMSEERGSERTGRSVNEQHGGELRTGRAVEEGGGGRGGHVQIDAGQRSRIVDTIRRSHFETINHVDFSIGVGAVVPTHYHFYTLPPEIVEIVPEYRGYDYIVVGNQILIIDPFTHRIVDVIDEVG